MLMWSFPIADVGGADPGEVRWACCGVRLIALNAAEVARAQCTWLDLQTVQTKPLLPRTPRRCLCWRRRVCRQSCGMAAQRTSSSTAQLGSLLIGSRR